MHEKERNTIPYTIRRAISGDEREKQRGEKEEDEMLIFGGTEGTGYVTLHS